MCLTQPQRHAPQHLFKDVKYCAGHQSQSAYKSLKMQSIIELSRTQDEEVGDGTTSVIILGKRWVPDSGPHRVCLAATHRLVLTLSGCEAAGLLRLLSMTRA